MKTILIAVCSFLLSVSAFGQSGNDIFDVNQPVTWLGLDFTQVKFIGDAAQWNDAGQITNAQMRDKYFVAWNNLFVNEKDKYKVADAIKRTEVGYALNVTEKANNALKGNFFESDGDMYQLLDEQKIKALVKKYDFKGNNGIGFLFFVEGMSKVKEEGSMWATFVDMKTRTVLLTKRVTGKSGGFGFRNYWAKTFVNGLKEVKAEWKDWKNAQ